MANVSSSNGLEKRPKLRFPGFDEPWTKHNLDEMLCSRVEKQIPSVEAPLMAFTAEGGVEPKGERYDRSYLVKSDKKLYKRTEYNDFIYSSNNLDVGSIGLNKYGTAVISDVYEIFYTKKDTSPTFVSELIQRPHILSEVLKYRQGCLYGQYRIYAEDFLKVSVYAPSINEQTKISAFLDSLDKKIAAQHRLVEALKKYKRGLSDSIFDAIAKMETSIVAPFGSILSILQNNTFSRDELFSSNDGVKNIHYGDVLIKYGAVLNMSSTQVPTIKPGKDLGKYSSSSYLLNGDVVFADTAEDYSVGKATEIYNADGLAILSGLHTIPCRSNTAFAPMYLGYYFNSGYFKSQIYPMIQGTKVSSISKSEIIKTTLLIPPYSTQEKIAAVLRKLDARIEIEEKTVLELIQVKCGVLQQLFI